MTRRRDTQDRIPEPDAPAGEVERVRAGSFAELVDRLIEGDELPPAMASDDRALLETAEVVRAGARGAELAPGRAARLVDEALARPSDRAGALLSSGPDPEPDLAPAPDPAPGIGPVPGARRSRSRRVPAAVPWIAAGVAAAAALILALWRPAPERRASATRALPEAVTSRPADALVGAIPRERAGAAGERADALFADRLHGYRRLRWGGER